MIISNKIYFHSYDKIDNIIFNGITGALDIVNKDVASMLKHNNIDMLDKLEDETLDHLRTRGYIFKNIEEKNNLEASIYNNYLEIIKDEPLIFSICPTLKCNLNCVYCFESDLVKKSGKLTNDMIDSIFAVIKQKTLSSNKKVIIELYGGEPLLAENYEINSKIFKYVVENNYEGINIITNGVELDNYESLIAEYPNVVKNMQITIDGPEEIHDKRRCGKDGKRHFRDIISNIKKVLELGVLVTVRINVDKGNLPYIKELIDFLEDEFILYDNFKCYLTPVTSKNGDIEDGISEFELVKILDEISLNSTFIINEGLHLLQYIKAILDNESRRILPKFNYCEAVRGSYIAFCPDGKVYPCSETVGINELSIGTYFPNLSIDEEKFKGWTNKSIINRKQCKECSISLLCGGGCALQNYYSNSINKSNNCKNSFKILEEYISDFKIKRGLK